MILFGYCKIPLLEAFGHWEKQQPPTLENMELPVCAQLKQHTELSIAQPSRFPRFLPRNISLERIAQSFFHHIIALPLSPSCSLGGG